MCKKILVVLAKIVAAIVGVAASLAVGSFLVYMFNLDMKLLAFLEPYLAKVYDLRKDRKRMI